MFAWEALTHTCRIRVGHHNDEPQTPIIPDMFAWEALSHTCRILVGHHNDEPQTLIIPDMFACEALSHGNGIPNTCGVKGRVEWRGKGVGKVKRERVGN